MKRPLAVLAAAALVSPATIPLLAQQTPPQSTSWKTNDGEFAIDGILRHDFSRGKDSVINIDFEGNPLKGKATPLNLTFQAQTLTGQFAPVKKGRYYLQNADLTGKVVLTKSDEVVYTLVTERLNLKETTDQKTTTATLPVPFTVSGSNNSQIKAGSGSVQFVAGESGRSFKTLELKNGFSSAATVTNTDLDTSMLVTGQSATVDADGKIATFSSPSKFETDYHVTAKPVAQAKDQKIHIVAGSGSVAVRQIPSAGKRPITSANLKDRVSIDAKSFVDGGKDSNGKALPPEPIHIEATGDRLTFDQDGNLKLSGNVVVKVNGDQGFYGTADVLQVTFDEKMNVVSWEAHGGPAKIQGAAKTDKSGGGRRNR